MSDKNKQVLDPNEASNSEEEANLTPSKWKRFTSKKWVFPAMYIAAAAIILSLMWAYQDSGQDVASETDLGLTPIEAGLDATLSPDENAVAVTAETETMAWPVANFEALQVVMPFYEVDATGEEKQAAMLEHDDMFIPSTGISLAQENNESFEVLAAMSGTVTRVEQLPLVGHTVEITHENGLKTIYQSLSDVSVTLDQEVAKGDVIAMAGRNELQKDFGVHVHFEVHQNDQPMNPEQFLIES